MEPNNIPSRELTRAERTAIRRLVTRMCANYDNEYGCLLLDGACYMLNKWWTGSYCKYFRNAVLPLDPILEAALLNNDTRTQKVCPICGKTYIPVTSQAYCSDACRICGQREADKIRKRNKRKNKG